MEKQKTPLMMLIEKYQEELRIIKYKLSSGNFLSYSLCALNERKGFIESLITYSQSLLLTEEQVIKDAAIKCQSYWHNKNNDTPFHSIDKTFEVIADDYFTQTFNNKP